MLAFYRRMLLERPVVTKSVTAAVIMVSGDAIQQRFEHQARLRAYERSSESDSAEASPASPASVALEERPDYLKDYDVARSTRMGVFALAIFGPVMSRWYGLLDRLYPGTSTKAVLLKTALDQAAMSPTFTLAFFTAIGAMEGRSLPEIKAKIADAYVPTLITTYQVWPVAQLVNFYAVPPSLRVLWTNAVGLGFNTYLSKMGNRDARQQATEAGQSAQTVPNQ